MNDYLFHERFSPIAKQWGEWLAGHGLAGLADSFLEAFEPLATLSAQALYVAQPALGLVIKHDQIREWAYLLETPGALSWFRQQLRENWDNDKNYG